jgi:eukaryotic-like serine/threonine-protein kinase
MTATDQGRIWAEASSPPIASLVRRFTAAWRARTASPPDPKAYLPDEPDRRASALLALLRADLGLRREAGESARVERYLRSFPDLAEDVLVALIYEEFCLREEAGESPDPSEYRARFPAVAGQVRELIDLHEFVGGTVGSLMWQQSPPQTAPFPEAGETIGGFRLLEELGQGGIARVFLAEERHLADRRVALKVSRAGSREPQTLARLQHTHIVPVHSYQVDVVTGHHLLCMPYLGRVTLADVLADPRARAARTGVDLLAALDGLRPAEEPEPLISLRSEARVAIRGRTIAQAIAWWGARLAEALQHAHDRGVLHRDIKPSNVIVTADATPMLLDFNLASPSDIDGHGAADIGGTPAYMAPEHIEAAARVGEGGDGDDLVVDGRADIYSLGVVLYETLTLRPFSRPAIVRPDADSLRLLIEARKTPMPRLTMGAEGRKIPAALGAVVGRCLEPDPADRYAAAAELAADLQAVADNGPLRFAREPQPSRAVRWAARNRRMLFIALAMLAAAAALFAAQSAEGRRERMARSSFEAGLRSAGAGEFVAAAEQFATAADLTSGSWSRTLRSMAGEASRRRQDALRAERIRRRADAFFEKAESIRFRLITRHGLGSASRDLLEAFGEFQVLGRTPWTRDPELDRLDPHRHARLIEEANELLFLWVVDADWPGDLEARRQAEAICERALSFAEPKGPWFALKARYEGPDRPADRGSPLPSTESSARACFEWGLLCSLDGRPDRSLAWFERAVGLRPDWFWYQFALAYHHAAHGDARKAMAHYTAAEALRPGSSWALLNRARVAWSRLAAWESAMRDIDRVRAKPDGLDPGLLDLELGRVAQRLGDFPTALAHDGAVIASDAGGDLVRHARLNRAQVEAELGPRGRDRAWAEYESLLADDPGDAGARLGRAVLALRTGRAEVAEADLTILLDRRESEPGDAARRAEWFAARALSRLALRRPVEAECDAMEAVRIAPSLARLRVLTRAAIAAGRDGELAALDPDDLDRLPAGGSPLAADLRAAVARPIAAAEGAGRGSAQGPSFPQRMRQAAMLSALGDHSGALREADRAVAENPSSAEVWLLRARVRRRARDHIGASADIEQGLALAPGDPRLQTARGRLLIEEGKPLAALAVLELALAEGAGRPAHAVKARALGELGQVERGAGEWTLALRDDPEDADAFLGRARCFIRLGRWDPALADLESAVNWSGDRPTVLIQAVGAYAACLPRRPGHLSRVLGLVGRAARCMFR